MKTEKELRVTAKIMHDSIEWWKRAMAYWVIESDRWEGKEDDPYYEEKMEEISDAMNYLILKGEWENEELVQLEENIVQFEIHRAFDPSHKKFTIPPRQIKKDT